MKLYVCFTETAGPNDMHPCGAALKALRAAGHEPEVQKAWGHRLLPGFINARFEGRREAKRLTGSYDVPVLVLDGGEAVSGSEEIIAWARAHPAGA